MAKSDSVARFVVSAAIIVALLGFGSILWTTGTRHDGENETITNSPDDIHSLQASSTLLRIIDSPDSYYEKLINIRGNVQDIISSRLFTVSAYAGGAELLVLIPVTLTDAQADTAARYLTDNARVSITGNVRPLHINEIEQRFRIELPEEVTKSFSKAPVLVAQRVYFTGFKTEYFNLLGRPPITQQTT